MILALLAHHQKMEHVILRKYQDYKRSYNAKASIWYHFAKFHLIFRLPLFYSSL